MLGKRLSMKKLAKRVTVSSNNIPNGMEHDPSQSQCLLTEFDQGGSPRNSTPTGSFAVYVGEERRRFIVPTSYLSHPLFKIMLDKAYTDNTFGFEHKSGLVVPCSVSAFQEVVSAVECCNRKFDFGDLVEEFI